MSYYYKTITLLMAILLFSSSCTKEADSEESIDITTDVVGVYKGEMSDFMMYHDDYTVIVSSINDSRVKIIPSGSEQSTFEVDIEKVNENTIISINPTPTFTLTFIKTSGVYELTYWFTDADGYREDYRGYKQ